MESEVALPLLLCPQGFVPTNDNTSLLIGSIFDMHGCVEACRRPIFTPHQYAEADGLSKLSSYLGFGAILFLRFAWQLKRDQPKRQYCITQFIFISLVGSVGFVLSSTAKDINSVLCRSEIRPRAQRDGFSLCILQSAIMIFSSLALSLAWLAQLIDLYLKLVRGHKTTDQYRYYYMALIYVYPLTAVLLYGAFGMYGYNGWNQYCTQHALPPGMVSAPLLIFFLPAVLIQLAGVVLLGLLVVKIVRTWFIITTSPPPLLPLPMASSSLNLQQQQQHHSSSTHSQQQHHRHSGGGGAVMPLPQRASAVTAHPGGGGGVAVAGADGLRAPDAVLNQPDVVLHQLQTHTPTHTNRNSARGRRGSSANSSYNKNSSRSNSCANRSFADIVTPSLRRSLLSLLTVRNRGSCKTAPLPHIDGAGAAVGIGAVTGEKNDGVQGGAEFDRDRGRDKGRDNSYINRGSRRGVGNEPVSPSASASASADTQSDRGAGAGGGGAEGARGSSGQQQPRAEQKPVRQRQGQRQGQGQEQQQEQKQEGEADAGTEAHIFPTTPPAVPPAVPSPAVPNRNSRRELPRQLLVKSLTGSTGLIVFCVLFLFCWCCFFAIKVQDVLSSKQGAVSLANWLACVRTQFDGVSDDSWISVCGEQPAHYAGKHTMHLVATFLTNGQSLVVSAVLASQFLNLCRGKKQAADRELARMIEIRRSRAQRRRQTIIL